jgi:hypothetical protein
MNETYRAVPLPGRDAHARRGAFRRALVTAARQAFAQGDFDAAEMAEAALDTLVSGDLAAFASAIGLVERGGVSRDMAAALSDRDFLIAALHREIGLADRGLAGAALIVQRFRRYESGAWPRDRGRTDPPEDRVAALCWNLLHLDLPDSRRMPSPESVAAILKKVQSMF